VYECISVLVYQCMCSKLYAYTRYYKLCVLYTVCTIYCVYYILCTLPLSVVVRSQELPAYCIGSLELRELR
jgi:hypothetical protein